MIKHRMGCFVAFFLTNILQNRRKRISATLLDDGTRHGHTLSQPAHNVAQPSACQRNAIQNVLDVAYQKKEERKAGGGGGWLGTGLRALLEPIQCLWCFFLHVLLLFFTGFFFLGGGVNC